MVEINQHDYPTLSNVVDWENVKARFSLTTKIDEAITSNVNVIPYVKDKYVIIQIANGRCELPGGTM